ncbi:hypothetical protein INTERNEXUS_63 [Bacillus phage vB_BspM_Internexus]|nr:hypothetical protein INTERNEXUS_63 [Bacillus phage vB_BspM_Internexus]
MKTTITAEELVEAYKKTGIKPINKVYVNPVINCGCALSVLSISNSDGKLSLSKINAIRDVEELEDIFRNKIGLDPNYNIEAFMDGFDCIMSGQMGTREWDEGYKCANVIKEEFLINDLSRGV